MNDFPVAIGHRHGRKVVGRTGTDESGQQSGRTPTGTFRNVPIIQHEPASHVTSRKRACSSHVRVCNTNEVGGGDECSVGQCDPHRARLGCVRCRDAPAHVSHVFACMRGQVFLFDCPPTSPTVLQQFAIRVKAGPVTLDLRP